MANLSNLLTGSSVDGKAFCSIQFDKTKFDMAKSQEWLLAHSVNHVGFVESARTLDFGLRKAEDFITTDSTDYWAIAEGVGVVLKEAVPQAIAPAPKTFTQDEIRSYFEKMIREENGKFCVYTHDGKKNLGCHSTKEEARAHLIAIEINKVDEESPLQSTMKLSKNEDGSASWELDIPIMKLNLDERLAGGVVYAPDVVDLQGDSASPTEVMKACHNFSINKGKMGVMHQEDVTEQVTIVENYIAPTAFHLNGHYIRKGSWVMVVKIHDDKLWERVKKGELTGFSMGGRAQSDN